MERTKDFLTLGRADGRPDWSISSWCLWLTRSLSLSRIQVRVRSLTTHLLWLLPSPGSGYLATWSAGSLIQWQKHSIFTSVSFQCLSTHSVSLSETSRNTRTLRKLLSSSKRTSPIKKFPSQRPSRARSSRSLVSWVLLGFYMGPLSEGLFHLSTRVLNIRCRSCSAQWGSSTLLLLWIGSRVREASSGLTSATTSYSS